MAQHLHASLSLGNLPLGKREDGEGLESCEKTCEELSTLENTAVDSLLRDTITELQKALYESKRLLAERDTEILTLRNELEESRKESEGGRSFVIEDEFKKSQMKVIDLEKTVHQLQQDITSHKTQEKEEFINKLNAGEPGELCYCGSICLAMKEVVDLKRKLHHTEYKYLQLKKNIRSKEREARERNRVKVGVAHRDSPCTVS
ncbi:predicted protein [Nematostella vectensis]|uniref:Uncharacterized protein n=1 Tax=Nematostella vectensis TaxID=45351 RepID=A7RQ75_NEMVE|nr:predicted protein [Nematostella vectensis]|eukprot:XP_001638508.1 predicted protein [Nematostella vectensis]